MTPVPCSECGIEFGTLTDLHGHQRTCNGKKAISRTMDIKNFPDKADKLTLDVEKLQAANDRLLETINTMEAEKALFQQQLVNARIKLQAIEMLVNAK